MGGATPDGKRMEADEMTDNEVVEIDLRNEFAAIRHSSPGDGAVLRNLEGKVEDYLEWCAAERKRRQTLRERIEAEFDAYIGAGSGAAPRDLLRTGVVQHIYDADDEATDLHQRMAKILREIQEERARSAP